MKRIRIGVILIPVFLAAACAGSKGATITAQVSAVDSADYVYVGVEHIMTSAGVRQAQLDSDTSYVFDSYDRFELRGNIRLVVFDSIGVPTATLTAREATYSIRAKRMEARGDVVVTTTDGKRLDTQQLIYDQEEGRIRSDSAFVIVAPDLHGVGPSFVSDPNLEAMTCPNCTWTRTGSSAPPPPVVIPPPPAGGTVVDTSSVNRVPPIL